MESSNFIVDDSTNEDDILGEVETSIPTEDVVPEKNVTTSTIDAAN